MKRKVQRRLLRLLQAIGHVHVHACFNLKIDFWIISAHLLISDMGRGKRGNMNY